MWQGIFDRMAARLIRTGALRVTYPDGTTRLYGAPDAALQSAIRIRDTGLLRELCLRPDLALGEGYMDARLEFENDDVEGFLRLVLANDPGRALPLAARVLERARMMLRDLGLRNDARRARRNVAHHYDISDDLYRLFLDADMQYSCAYFADPRMTLEEAQAAKKAHIAAKLRLEPGMRVLDIGSGWGGMAITLAQDYGARVVGVTLSDNQLATARRRAEAAGLGDRIDFRLQDYRDIDETFDRIVSVGMLEHVGVPQYATYFDKVADLLDPDGVALIHTIGRCAPPDTPSRWISKYIFPGGYVPSLSELAPAVEDSGLWISDLEVLRLHYAMTIRHWRRRFQARIDEVRRMHDDRFVRMWSYYLTACIMAFEAQMQAVFQFQLARRRDAVPLTRDYLYAPTLADARSHAAE
jgi:cyclopropane-fatty-acyl-phospholipid synthase